MECFNGETLSKCARQCVCVSLLGEERRKEKGGGDEKTNRASEAEERSNEGANKIK